MAKITRSEIIARGYRYLPQFGYFYGGAGIKGTTSMQPGKYNGYYYP